MDLAPTFSTQTINLTFPPFTEGHHGEGSANLHTAQDNTIAKPGGMCTGLAHIVRKHPWPFNTAGSVSLHAMSSGWILPTVPCEYFSHFLGIGWRCAWPPACTWDAGQRRRLQTQPGTLERLHTQAHLLERLHTQLQALSSS